MSIIRFALTRQTDKVSDRDKIDFKPGELLGSVSGELGLRKFLERLGHTFVVTSDKDGENSVFERELPESSSRNLSGRLT